MALVIRKTIELLKHWNNECSDDRVRDWFLLDNPLPVLCIIAVYIYFVKKIGPSFMENREPYKLTRVIQVYNIIQVVICAYLVLTALSTGYITQYNWICQSVDYTEKTILSAKIGYYYFLTKLVDLLDTVFFVLRKRQRQVTFLHVYHHSLVTLGSWIGVKYVSGGHSIFFGHINSFVHMIMYFYYFLTSLDDKYKKNIWWKKHITQLQMIQFGLIALHYSLLVLQPWFAPDCTYPRWTILGVVPQNTFMFLMFYDFYKKAYLQKETKQN